MRKDLGLINLLEAGGCVLQVTTNIFTGLHDALRGGTPILVQLLVPLAADALPVALKRAGVILNLWLDLVADLVVELDEDLAQIAHEVGIYVNCSHY
ncbi:MAG TPA: hypothetical protein VGN15_00855 [Ktedonobacteraceae bacterium]|nr:hypothetical protein [Ktedonobacteraceae bacterium]